MRRHLPPLGFRLAAAHAPAVDEPPEAAHRNECRAPHFGELDISVAHEFVNRRAAEAGHSDGFRDTHTDRLQRCCGAFSKVPFSSSCVPGATSRGGLASNARSIVCACPRRVFPRRRPTAVSPPLGPESEVTSLQGTFVSKHHCRRRDRFRAGFASNASSARSVMSCGSAIKISAARTGSLTSRSASLGARLFPPG